MKLHDFTLRYGRRVILDHVNIEFPPGTTNHLLGRNGTGKSSLAKALAGMIPHGGRIEGLDTPVALIGSYSRIPEDLRVSDVISETRKVSDANLFEELYQGLSLASLAPSQRVGKLSDGQRQKLKLFCFLSAGQKTVIMDELTAALDRQSAEEIGTFLGTYLDKPHITSINITHDVSDLERMPGKCFLLEDGSVLPESSKRDVVGLYLGRSALCV